MKSTCDKSQSQRRDTHAENGKLELEKKRKKEAEPHPDLEPNPRAGSKYHCLDITNQVIRTGFPDIIPALTLNIRLNMATVLKIP
jgi:hypothetical protein